MWIGVLVPLVAMESYKGVDYSIAQHGIGVTLQQPHIATEIDGFPFKIIMCFQIHSGFPSISMFYWRRSHKKWPLKASSWGADQRAPPPIDASPVLPAVGDLSKRSWGSGFGSKLVLTPLGLPSLNHPSSNGKKLQMEGCNGKNIYKWWMFHGDLKLPEGITLFGRLLTMQFWGSGFDPSQPSNYARGSKKKLKSAL